MSLPPTAGRPRCELDESAGMPLSPVLSVNDVDPPHVLSFFLEVTNRMAYGITCLVCSKQL